MQAIDWSPVDRAVEKVIAKHEALFAIDRIMAEKIDSDFHPLIKAAFLCSKVARVSAQFERLKAIYRAKPSHGPTYLVNPIRKDEVITGQALKLALEQYGV